MNLLTVSQQQLQEQHGHIHEHKYILDVDILEMLSLALLLELELVLLAEGSDMIPEESSMFIEAELIEKQSDWLSSDVLELVELSEYDVGSDFTTNEP